MRASAAIADRELCKCRNPRLAAILGLLGDEPPPPPPRLQSHFWLIELGTSDAVHAHTPCPFPPSWPTGRSVAIDGRAVDGWGRVHVLHVDAHPVQVPGSRSQTGGELLV